MKSFWNLGKGLGGYCVGLVLFFVCACRQSPVIQIQTEIKNQKKQWESIAATLDPSSKKSKGNFLDKTAKESCRFLRDRQRDLWWIDFEKAEERDQYLYCVGFLHGKDRPWQMQLLKEIAQGRRAERTGFQDLKRDFAFRLFDFEERSKALFEASEPEFKLRLIRYAMGINEGFLEALQNAGNSKQWKLYGPHTLEAWKPENAILVLLLQSLDQTRKSIEQDSTEEEWLTVFGPTRLRNVMEAAMPWDAPILSTLEAEKKGRENVPEKRLERVSKTNLEIESGAGKQAAILPPRFKWINAESFFGSQENNETGSNSWILPHRGSGDSTILANDPHLNLQRPPLWYLTGVSVDRMPRRLGVTVPGIPIQASGANQKVSWGITNAYAKFGRVIEIKDDAEKNTFRPVVWFSWFGLKIPVFWKTMARAPAGWPILPVGPDKKIKALVWSGFLLGPKNIQAMFDLHYAASAQEFDETLKRADVPGWNIVYADKQGNSGYRMMGMGIDWKPGFGVTNDPFKTKDKREKSKGWWFEKSEVPIVPLASRPHQFLRSSEKNNFPINGFLVTANQRQYSQLFSEEKEVSSAGGDSRHRPLAWLGVAHVESFRGFRIKEMLSQGKSLNESNFPPEEVGAENSRVKKMIDIQCDVQAPDAQFLVPRFKKLTAELFPKDLDKQKRWEEVEIWLQSGAAVSGECGVCVFYEVFRELTFKLFGINSRWFYWLTSEEMGVRSDWLTSKEAKLLWKDIWLASEHFYQRRNTWNKVHLAPFLDLLGNNWFPEEKSKLATAGGEYSVNPGTWAVGTAGPSGQKLSGAEMAGNFNAIRELTHTSGASWRLVVQVGQKMQMWFQTSGPNESEKLGAGSSNGEKLNSSQRWKDWVECKNYRYLDFSKPLDGVVQIH